MHQRTVRRFLWSLGSLNETPLSTLELRTARDAKHARGRLGFADLGIALLVTPNDVEQPPAEVGLTGEAESVSADEPIVGTGPLDSDNQIGSFSLVLQQPVEQSVGSTPGTDRGVDVAPRILSDLNRLLFSSKVAFIVPDVRFASFGDETEEELLGGDSDDRTDEGNKSVGAFPKS